jgi:DNA-binding transcriptional ArsR family regulator
MSITLMTMAWKTAFQAGRKMVLLALCDNASDEGMCYPSVATLVRKCSMAERTVQGHIADLEKLGIVRREFRTGRSTLYQIDGSKICTPQNLHPTPADTAPPPPQPLHPPPAGVAPITIIEPSVEPPVNPTPGKTAKKHHGTDDDYKAANWMFDLVRKVNPTARQMNPDVWANEIRLMREIDGRTHAEVCALFLWAKKDSFWCANIQSPAKLREKWDTLTVRMQQNPGTARPAGAAGQPIGGSVAEQNAANAAEAKRLLFGTPAPADTEDEGTFENA